MRMVCHKNSLILQKECGNKLHLLILLFKMINDSLIILAAGLSSRMKKSVASNNLSENSIIQANKIEKGLIGIGEEGKPLIHYLLLNAKSAGFNKIYFVIGENSSS